MQPVNMPRVTDRATGTGGPFAGSGMMRSCCLCHRHRPPATLDLFRKGTTLRRCTDREACDQARGKTK